MKIGIIEVCEPNHYTAVIALAETYATHPENDITIFTTPTIQHLLTYPSRNIRVVLKKDNQSMGAFLAASTHYTFDRLHINTISNYYHEFASTSWTSPIYFTIHNINLWYGNSLITRIKSLLFDYKELINIEQRKKHLLNPFILFIKDFKRQAYRNRFIKKISVGEYKIIVYSESQKVTLSNSITANKIIVFPFCLHTPLEDQSINNKKLVVCIPGTVSTRRRNYVALFQVLEERISVFKDQLLLDLLGYIPPSDYFLEEQIKHLQNLGLEIKYNFNFISSTEFDDRLSQADIILGNLKSQISVNSEYGKTKETGVIFNIIKAGKPGLLPEGYPLDGDLKSICQYFKNYEHLSDCLQHMIFHKEDIHILKKTAATLVQKYEPANLYKKLAEEHTHESP